MSVVRGLATDPDPAGARRRTTAELEAWDGVTVPLAAALNAFKGEANVLNRRGAGPTRWIRRSRPTA
jgi:oligoendopeptidase F